MADAPAKAEVYDGPVIRVPKWDDFQHYGKRSPPWIKLHRAILDKKEWHALSGDASKLLAECWLVASEHDKGRIPMSVTDLAWRLRRNDTARIASLLVELADADFLDLSDSDASAVLARCKQDARQRRGEGRGEAEAENANEASSLRSESPFGENRHVENSPEGDVGEVLAPLIRQHLWLGKRPPRTTARGEWNMGRDLSIARKLMEEASPPATLDEMAALLPLVRGALGIPDDSPMTLLPLASADRRDRFNLVLHTVRKRRGRKGAAAVPHITDLLEASRAS